jgi:hypothetical protein
MFKFKSRALNQRYFKINQNKFWKFELNFKSFWKSIFWILRLLNQKYFSNLIQNSNHEDFRKKAFRASFQIWFWSELKSNSNFDENERFLHALED